MPENRMMIAVDTETYDDIVNMAEAEGRTIGKQVAVIVDFVKKYRVVSISTLPHPPDAQPVPLITIAEG